MQFISAIHYPYYYGNLQQCMKLNFYYIYQYIRRVEAETHDAVWKPKQKFVMDGLCNTHDEYTYFPVQPPILQ